ncbi:hypothetical protein [Herbiconiux sp. UC225_62]|uniref:hypothetical protein n=1 Tax=Herbiconiux sp. UC225_62 TaxID=3350168 RepID=UPI0036D426DC
MITTRLRPAAALLLGTAAAGSLAACSTEYHGHDSGIDGELWDRMASFEDPLLTSVFDPLDETIGILHTMIPEQYPPAVSDPDEYLAGILAPRWDGAAASVPELGLDQGGAILYDAVSTESDASFSIFIASGPRSNGPDDSGRVYSGPSEVYTCYRFDVRFEADASAHARQTIYLGCPAELVDPLADDAAFASAEVFAG